MSAKKKNCVIYSATEKPSLPPLPHRTYSKWRLFFHTEEQAACGNLTIFTADAALEGGGGGECNAFLTQLQHHVGRKRFLRPLQWNVCETERKGVRMCVWVCVCTSLVPKVISLATAMIWPSSCAREGPRIGIKESKRSRLSYRMMRKCYSLLRLRS
jgi:hypothetical protein